MAGRNVGVATLGDRLALTIAFTPLMDVDWAESKRAATAFLSAGVKRLELAVQAIHRNDSKVSSLTL